MDRDYLMAVAYCRSDNLKDMGTATSDEVGPFKISAREWNTAITEGVAKDLGFTVADRYSWNLQPAVAALLAVSYQKRLREALNQEPTRSQLFFTQLYGAGAEAVLQQDAAKACKDIIGGTPADGSYAARLQGSTLTLGAALNELKAELQEIESRIARTLEIERKFAAAIG